MYIPPVMMVLSSNPSNAIDAQMFVPVERLMPFTESLQEVY